MKSNFEAELTSLINKYSMENGSDTPDYVLAQYMFDCLKAFEKATNIRDKWCGRVSADMKSDTVDVSNIIKCICKMNNCTTECQWCFQLLSDPHSAMRQYVKIAACKI